MGTIKPWEELSFRDDYMFKRVMRHKRFCKRMLEKILRIEIRDIRYLEDEKTIKTAYESKGIRLDVYVEDDRNTVYNVDYSEFRVIPINSCYNKLLLWGV